MGAVKNPGSGYLRFSEYAVIFHINIILAVLVPPGPGQAEWALSLAKICAPGRQTFGLSLLLFQPGLGQAVRALSLATLAGASRLPVFCRGFCSPGGP